MQPTWGNNRTFVPVNASLVPPAPIAFSTSITSQYFAQYLEVYTKNKSLTSEEKEIAVWWAITPSRLLHLRGIHTIWPTSQPKPQNYFRQSC
jgi:hypothetical protein